MRRERFITHFTSAHRFGIRRPTVAANLMRAVCLFVDDCQYRRPLGGRRFAERNPQGGNL
jgi:hypothetical protein